LTEAAALRQAVMDRVAKRRQSEKIS